MILNDINQAQIHQLHDIMRKNTANCYNQINDFNYSWGTNKCLVSCDDISNGWETKDIIIDGYISDSYELDDQFLNDFEKYKQSDYAIRMLSNGKNMPRCMLVNYSSSLNNDGIHFILQKTDYLTDNFFWDKYKKSSDYEKQRTMSELFNEKSILPNSLCVHLVLLTNDNKIIVTSTSINKTNDYPLSWAVTIGEQIEISDFYTNSGIINQNFTYRAVKRAMHEEFGIQNEQFNAILQNNAIRILSLNSEGDINNISIMAVAHLSCNFSKFMYETSKHQKIDNEFSDVSAIDIDDIPILLSKYDQIKHAMHPSSFLRLLLCYLHCRSIPQFIEKYQQQIA